MNKYMRRGIMLVLLGVAFILLGYYLRNNAAFKYGWAMIVGTLAFGAGFLFIIYSLIRKIDRRAILKERAADAENESSK